MFSLATTHYLEVDNNYKFTNIVCIQKLSSESTMILNPKLQISVSTFSSTLICTSFYWTNCNGRLCEDVEHDNSCWTKFVKFHCRAGAFFLLRKLTAIFWRQLLLFEYNILIVRPGLSVVTIYGNKMWRIF